MNKSSLVVALILIVLIGLALWQFHSLAWAEVIRTSHATPGTIDVFGEVTNLARAP